MAYYDYYEIVTNNSYTPPAVPVSPDNIPVISIKTVKNLSDLSGSYTIEYPNFGGAINKFTQFDKQQIYIKDFDTTNFVLVFTGQVNSSNISDKSTILTVNGRGLNGMLTDRKRSDSWEDKRADYILCDPTYGAIPLEYGSYITTWNAFTDYSDQFSSWNTSYWGTIPAYCSISSGTMVFAGNAGADRILYGARLYNFETIEFRLKVDIASNNVRFGFGDNGLTEYVRFELTSTGVNAQTKTAGVSSSSAVVSPPTQTIYNYYRIEWDNGEARFFINGLLTNTVLTNVPLGTLYAFIEMANTAQTSTTDYVKVIALTNKVDRYVTKETPLIDITQKMCDVGSFSNSFVFFIDDNFDLNAKVETNTYSGYSYQFNSVTHPAYTKVSDIKLNDEAKDLYNVISITGGEVETAGFVDNYVGNASQAAFTLSFKAKKTITSLTVGGVTKTENTHFTVVYGNEHTVVTFTAGNIPGAGAAIVVTYTKLLPIVSITTNPISIAALKNANFDGRREYSQIDDTIKSQSRADQLSNALLLYYSDPRTVVKITVPLNPNLDIGETVYVDAPKYNITNMQYGIIEVRHTIEKGKWNTDLILASSEINTNAEILKDILQQLKTLRNKGDTDATTVETQINEETLQFSDAMTEQDERICDSFVSGHPDDNGKLGRGTILDDFEITPPNWTPTNASVSRSNTQFLVGSYSMKVISTNSPVTLLDTTSRGNLSNFLSDTLGTVGIWVYISGLTDLTSITLRIGSDSSNYVEVTGKIYAQSDFIPPITGWNYVIFRLSTGAKTGTPNWAAVAYTRFVIVVSGTPTFYLDYHTCGDGDKIGLNGLGARTMLLTENTITLLG